MYKVWSWCGELRFWVGGVVGILGWRVGWLRVLVVVGGRGFLVLSLVLILRVLLGIILWKRVVGIGGLSGTDKREKVRW